MPWLMIFVSVCQDLRRRDSVSKALLNMLLVNRGAGCLACMLAEPSCTCQVKKIYITDFKAPGLA